jgi:hypothetical protein
MLQLRNRYNLEKRKLESSRSEALPNPKSPWPLYKYLLFFDGHIKQRRSYKMLRKIQEAEASVASDKMLRGETSSQANSSANESMHGDMSMLNNFIHSSTMMNNEIKNEDDEDLDMVEAIPILNENSSDNQM